MKFPVQFNWRRHWSKKVAPYLDNELVQLCLEFGMRLSDPNWQRGDAPYILGRDVTTRIVTGKLTWYQPWGRCHYIAYFSLAIGLLNYPDLNWRILSGDLHTVPVGYGPDGEPKVVMDILLFDLMTAGESIAQTLRRVDPDTAWSARICRDFFKHMLPVFRKLAEKRCKKKSA